MPLVLDLRIAHERFGCSSDPSINGHLHYPNNVDKSLNEDATNKIRKYRVDYHNNPPNSISFRPVIPRTSDRIHIQFVRLIFLQAHRETDRFFYIFRSSACTNQQWTFHHFKNTYSPITLTNVSSINLVFIFMCSSSPSNPVYTRLVDPLALVFSLSSQRHSYIGFVYSSRFIDS